MCWCPGPISSSCTPAGRCNCTGSSTSSRLSPTSTTSTPVSSSTSRTAASSGSSSRSMCPPGGGHMPRLRCQWGGTFPPRPPPAPGRLTRRLVPLDVPAGREPHAELAVPVEEYLSVPHHEDRHGEVSAMLPPIHSRRLHQ